MTIVTRSRMAGAVLFMLGLLVASRPAAGQVLEPVRPGLDAVPAPRLEDLEPAVADQLRDALAAFTATAARTGLSRPALAQAYGELARVFHAYEFFDAAEPAYANAVRLASAAGPWLHLWGYLLQQTGRLEAAADRLYAAVRARPDDRAAIVRLGDVYVGLGRLRDAREQFEQVSSTFPAAASNGLGEVALREGHYREAIEHFEAALGRMPQATAVHYSLAMAYRGLGRLDEARAHLERRGPGVVIVADPLVDDLRTLVRGERLLVIHGRRAYEAGQFQEAAALLRRAVEAAPDSVPARLTLGLSLAQLGDGDGALVHLRAAFARAPGDGAVGGALIGALVRFERADEAIAVLGQVRTAVPDDEQTLLGLVLLLAHRARYREAVALLEDGYRRFPERVLTATTLARLLSSSPDPQVRDGRRALELATAVYAVSTTGADAETVALALAEAGRCGEALDWIRRAVAQSRTAGDGAETARLTAEVPRYEARDCRAPAP